MSKNIQAIRGMNDILPEEAKFWTFLDSAVAGLFAGYGYGNMRLPVVEATPLFSRSIGEATDIVEKEMYSFVDELNGEHLTLRPEATASVVRASIEHSLLYGGPQRLYYFGPMYRHERPQKGRYRQFHQVGAEALGFPGPDIDAEMLLMCARLWEDLGVSEVRLQLNCLGSAQERAGYRASLVKYLEAHRDRLDEDSRRRLHANPLRALDSKNQAMQELIEGAPRLIDTLGEDSLKHFEGVQAVLREAGRPYEINPRLVRGLDYYNLTVFEWVTDRLGAQGTVCAGGRYDGLFGQMGGKPTPACGWAMGIERLLALVADAGERQSVDVYLVNQGEQASRFAFRVGEKLRDAGFSVMRHCGAEGFKSQMKRADASGAPIAVIVGDDEAQAGEASIKTLREEREQIRVALERLPDALADLLFSTDEDSKKAASE